MGLVRPVFVSIVHPCEGRASSLPLHVCMYVCMYRIKRLKTQLDAARGELLPKASEVSDLKKETAALNHAYAGVWITIPNNYHKHESANQAL